MIKLIAALTMVMDHVAAIVFPRTPSFAAWYEIFRAIGRVSMPLFGYCIARGFYYSEKHGTTKKYFKNLTIFSVVSQFIFTFVPYVMYEQWRWEDLYINIGFTWLFSVIILKAMTYLKKEIDKNTIIAVLVILAVVVASVLIPIDYGLYGVLFPIVFYYFMFKINSPLLCFILNIMQFFLYAIIEHISIFGGQSNQIISIFSIFIILALKEHDSKIKLPKFFFYWFYPIHIGIFVLIKYLFIMKK